MTSVRDAIDIPTEPDTSGADRFHALVARLSEQSVRTHFDAYVDVPWDDHPIHHDDPRWELPATDPLTQTPWYQALAPETRARLGLFSIVAKMKTGLEFENVLCRGILEFVNTLPNGSPEYRYAMHEMIEEGHHQLMFQEFINRSGIDVGGMPWPARIGSRFVVTLGRRFPELFFMFVLGGEDPIDHVQREALRSGLAHPLSERSCASTSPKRPATSPSPATSSRTESAHSRARSEPGWRSVHP